MILCKKCGSDNVHKNGTKEIKKEKRQVWKCKDCKHKFNTDFQEIELSGGKFKEYSKEELTENALYLETAVRNVRTIEDLIAFHDIDMNVWKIEKQVVNFWGKEGNRQVKGWFKKRDKSDIDFDKALEDFKEKASKYSPKVKKIKYKKEKNAKMLELGPVDHHLAQLSWDKETGFGDYDINIAKKLYLDAVEYLLQQSSFMYNIDEIMFTIGSDFYNSDTIDNTTTKGTIQSEDSRYQKSFDVGCDTIIEALNMCKQVAPVKGFVIQGNHDRQKTYYMGKVIEAWFRNDENIEIDTRPRLRKYHKQENWVARLYGANELANKSQPCLPKLVKKRGILSWN